MKHPVPLPALLLAAAFPAAVAFADIAPLPYRPFSFPHRLPEKDPPAVTKEVPPSPRENPAAQDRPVNPECPAPPLRPPVVQDMDLDF